MPDRPGVFADRPRACRGVLVLLVLAVLLWAPVVVALVAW